MPPCPEYKNASSRCTLFLGALVCLMLAATARAGAEVSAPSVVPGVVEEVNTADFNTIKLQPQETPVSEPAADTSQKKAAASEESESRENTVPVAEPAPNAAAVQAEEAPRAIAVASPVSRENDFVPIDLTPVRLPERVNTFNNFENFKAHALYRLPGRVFFNASVENSLRFEVNTFQTNRHYLSDMIYRVLPNVTVGYALTKKTRVSANYFFFRDQYDLRDSRLSRNIHSVGGRIDHDFNINKKTTLTVGLFPRALFISTANAPSVQFYDIIPSVTVVRRVGMSGVVYGSVMGQLRFRDPFSNFQEGDQFYSMGGVWRKGPWNYLLDSTLVTNFGYSNLRGGPNNQVIILTGEVGRRIHPRLPVTAFMRAEPIFNIGANQSPGFAGFNFRIFGGLRAEVAKPAIFPIKLKG